MDDFTEADLVWNRACDGQCTNPHQGDRALAALLVAHNLVMNGGVLHAVETLTPTEIADAQSGYRFFGLDSVATLLADAQRILKRNKDLETQESILDTRYYELVPDDSDLLERFEKHFQKHPSDFAPV